MPEPRTLILTRPRRQSEAFAAALAERMPGRFQVLVAPLIEVEPVPAAIDLAGAAALLFTSANGVEQFAAQSRERGLPAYCVGAMTAAAARAAGFEARSADGDVAALAALAAAEHRPDAGDLVHVRGEHAAGDLVGRLRAMGLPARAAEIYRQSPRSIGGAAQALLAAGGPVVLAFFSPRTAGIFAAEAGAAGWDLSRATAVSLSAATDAALPPGLGARGLAAAPTREAMLDALAAA